MDLSKKNTSIIFSIILALTFILNITTFRNGHNWDNSDFVGYISQAKGMIEGTVDSLVSHDKFMLENSTKDTGTLMGGWGFPIIFAPFYYIFGDNIYVMKVVTNFFFILALILIFHLFKERLRNLDNLLLIAIIALNPWFFDFKDNVLSDIPFLFFSLLSLFLIDRFIILKKIWINKLFSFFLIGVMIFISYNIRAVGLILLPTLMLIQFIESRSSVAVRAPLFSDKFSYVPYLSFIAFYVVIQLILTGSDTSSVYFSNLSHLSVKRLIFDIKYYAVLPSRFFPFLFLKMHGYGFEYNKFSLVLYVAMLILVIMGMTKNFRRDYLFIIYIIITLPVLMLFSSRQGFRLLIPIFPFFLYFLFKGLSTMSFSFDGFNSYKPIKIGVAYIFSAGLILISLIYISVASYKNITFNRTGEMEGPYSSDSIKLFNYIKTNTDKDAAIVFHEPRSMYLFAERKSFALSKGKFKFDQLLNSRARYLACEKKENPYNLSPEDLRSNFNCPYENDTFIICDLEDSTKQQND